MAAVSSDRLARFRRALDAPRSDLLFYGAEPAFVQFGPLVVRRRYVMILVVVTNRDGSLRAIDRLVDSDGPPHLTVGCQPDGGGRVEELHSRSVRWDVAGRPRMHPELQSPEWNRDTEFSLDMSVLARSIDADILGAAGPGPVAADIYFELEDEESEDCSQISRFVLVGGPALEIYRNVQAAFERQGWNSIRLARVSWLVFFVGCSLFVRAASVGFLLMGAIHVFWTRVCLARVSLVFFFWDSD